MKRQVKIIVESTPLLKVPKQKEHAENQEKEANERQIF